MRQRARVIYGAKAGETVAGRWFDERHARKAGEGVRSMRFIVAVYRCVERGDGRLRFVHGGADLERVDVHFRRGQGRLGRPVWEALGVFGVVRIERALADVEDSGDASEEDFGGREERESGVLMLVVVPGEERGEPATCVQ